MGFQQYSRGSLWRRWELHLHTPLTKKNDQYEGRTETEKWDNFYTTINNYIGDGSDPLKAICAIAITDYLSIDNYLKVRDDNRLPSCVQLLMPNVELRLEIMAGKAPVNIHCIFSPEIADQLNSRFFSRLHFKNASDTFSALKDELIRFGRSRLNQGASEEQAYSEGLEKFVINIELLRELFKNDSELRKQTIIVVSNKSGDGISGITRDKAYHTENGSQLDAIRESVCQFADMIFSSNENDKVYYLGEGIDSKELVKQKYGSLKPCIHGCDAHENAKVFEPDEKRYCWIKADPTFEGFKQILYEPNDRVCISPLPPESKQDYHVIDRVEIIENEEFSPAPIYLNDKLNCIIGGKSTGKSLLLHNIALAIDENQVKNKEETAKTNVKKIKGLQVYWRDDLVGERSKEARKIVYIPQTYLNRLSDEKEESTEIDTIIQEIILQDKNALQLFEIMQKKIADHKQLATKTIMDFIKVHNDIRSYVAKQKEIGDKIGITSEIEKLTGLLSKLSKDYNVTEDEIKEYQVASEKIQQLTNELDLLDREKKTFESIESVLVKQDFSQLGISSFNDPFRVSIEKIQQLANEQWLAERQTIINLIQSKITQLTTSVSEHEEKVKALKPKMEGNEQITKISSAILIEKSKLDKFEQIDIERKVHQVIYNSKLESITKSFEIYKNFYNEYVEGINKIFSVTNDDLEFEVTYVLRVKQFSQKLLSIINNKTISRFKSFSINSIEEADLTTENLAKLIEAIIAGSSETLQLIQQFTPESALRSIFDDWYNINFIVRMDGDSIEEMSPGKKALVLLKLLISLAESKCPILIDQPEDDLDNRSIFDELIQFIKKKKVDRQIIVATHNANIVLGGDAEEIIVANQCGKNSPNKAYRFEYRSGSIENDTPVKDSSGAIEEGILNNQGIQSHICEILEGGERAFDLRRNKYRFIK